MIRPLESGELLLLNALLAGVNGGWQSKVPLQDLVVSDMDDGGMGSLRIEASRPNRQFGRQLIQGWYLDADGLPISVSINIDQFDELYEVDSWKVDFSKRIQLPTQDNCVHIGLIQ